MILSDEDKILIKSLYLKRYIAKRMTDEFPEKSLIKCGVNKLFKKLRDIGTVNRRQAVADRAQCPHRRKWYASASEVPTVCH